MVLPLPQEAALQAGRRLEQRPVVGEAAVRVAHRVAVLAQDPRARVVRRRLHLALEQVELGVHRPDDVGDRRPALRPRPAPRAHDRALVVQRPRRVVGADPSGECLVVRAVARLVAERPHDHAGMVLVALHHAGAALQPRRAIVRVVAQQHVETVALDVGLVDDVETELVAQVEEPGIVRVVRATHGVHVVALHRDEVGAHVVDRHRFAALGVMIVTVDAADHHALAVDQQVAPVDGDGAEPDRVADGLLHDAIGRNERDDEAVAVRVLGRPDGDVGIGGRYVDDTAEVHVRADGHGNRPGHRRTDATAAAAVGRHRLQPGPDRPALFRERAVEEADGRAHAQRTGGARRIEARIDAYVGDVHQRVRAQEHFARQAAHLPVVLVLDVALCRPLHDHERQLVHVGAQVGGDVELGGEAAIGAHADGSSVDPHVEHGLRASDVQHGVPIAPRRGHAEPRAVHARGVRIRHRRRQPGERHLHVGVVRVVEAVCLTGSGRRLQRPVAGDVDRAPRRDVGAGGDMRVGHVLGAVEADEPPAPVERAEPRGVGTRRARAPGASGVRVGDERAARRQPVEGDRFRARPAARSERVDRRAGRCRGERRHARIGEGGGAHAPRRREGARSGGAAMTMVRTVPLRMSRASAARLASDTIVSASLSGAIVLSPRSPHFV